MWIGGFDSFCLLQLVVLPTNLHLLVSFVESLKVIEDCDSVLPDTLNEEAELDFAEFMKLLKGG